MIIVGILFCSSPNSSIFNQATGFISGTVLQVRTVRVFPMAFVLTIHVTMQKEAKKERTLKRLLVVSSFIRGIRANRLSSNTYLLLFKASQQQKRQKAMHVGS